MIKNIVFDFGGVLLDWNPRYLYRQYFKTEEEITDVLNIPLLGIIPAVETKEFNKNV